ncbi:ribonuclease HII [Microbacterium sp. cx-55]|uniref:ribonuclease HII n=1 Tax=Microbacterium sp. cx-55 TaxID=2875948 RepID=UPI001CC09363|nr:ribonuclease HII [Microbacterium sp. cx-55]MBZ4486134.1 ribonuclease HII [Microbacterium sp. cx-55]UGB33995.1 ribonuclease HII [Microbacterium sp. cx-55]
MTPPVPTLRLERSLWAEGRIVIACDEVGRGALAGPVAIGATVMAPRSGRPRVPEGLRDSKLIPEPRRADVAARAGAWVDASALGWSTSAEIDEVGIIRALGRAAHRAIDVLRAQGVPIADAIVILDGNHDYITPAGALECAVRPVIKADRDCASAAAASVLAKVGRDALMVDLHDEAPVYAWHRNKGYASAVHRAAIAEHGISAHHRSSWAISDAPALF